MTQMQSMSPRRYILPDKVLLAVEKSMSAHKIQPREFYYATSNLIANWILSSRNTKVYEAVLKMHNSWEPVLSAPVRMTGRYTHPENGKQEIVTDIFNPTKEFQKWITRFGIEHLEEHLEPIFPPMPDHKQNEFRRLVLAHTDTYVQRYAGIKEFSNTMVEWFLTSPKEPEHKDRRFGHLLARWDYRIIEWIEEESPPVLVHALYTPLSRTRHQVSGSSNRQGLTVGLYRHPETKEEVRYLGGQRPVMLQNWVDESGLANVIQWKVIGD
ncbi:hypothetical protein [Reinekea sp. G2M2-21]|uniref:hypothetical protein n=1 Tax=Reinekea sp. G2M2-21 TaxID=2788942 RepID=UPI0018AC12DC|nr:hypothetical protein [Reinekea sp. G2M2-21]